MINIAIYERGEHLIHRIEVRDRDNNKIASACSESIYDPCGFQLVTNAAFSQDSPAVTGDYVYAYNIPSTATYGEYRIVTSTTSNGYTTIQEDEFYVMPWKLEKDIRRITGIEDTKSINDDDLSHIAWIAYKEALRDVYVHKYAECPLGDPNTGNGVNGTNTTFQTRFHPIADINGDGSVGGNTSCATDIDAWWINSVGHRCNATVTVTQADNGEITITQTDGTAIPTTYDGLYIDYWHEYNSYDIYMLRDAVSFLAAHYVIELRMREVDKVTLADLGTNSPVIVKNERRFYDTYKRYLKKVCKPKVSGVR